MSCITDKLYNCICRLLLHYGAKRHHCDVLFNYLLQRYPGNFSEMKQVLISLRWFFEHQEHQEHGHVFDRYFKDRNTLDELTRVLIIQKKRAWKEEEKQPKKIQKTVLDDKSDDKSILFDFQKKSVIQLTKQRGLVLSYATGNGKTLVAVSATVVFSDLDVVVVAPKSLLSNFRHCLQTFGGGVTNRFAFYTFEKFSVEWLKDPELTRNKFLIVDECHHARTDVYANLFKKITNDQVRQVLEEEARKDFSDPIGAVKNKLGIFIHKFAPRSLRLIEAAKIAKKVLLLTATPCYNDTYDVANLASMAKGIGVMSRDYHRLLTKSPAEFSRFFRNTFAFKDIDKNDPDFPQLEVKTVRIPMTPEYYKAYHAVEERTLDNDKNPWIFLNGVRQATLGLENNPKFDFVLDLLQRDPDTPTLVHSSFVEKGLDKLKQLVKHIPFAEITGETTTRDRDRAVQAFNHGKIKLLFVSNAGGEGLDLKGLQRIILLETEWNMQQTMQVIGRGPRRHSHTHLPPEKRKCVAYQLILVKPPVQQRDPEDRYKKSADEILEVLTKEKQADIQDLLNKLKQC